MKKQNKQSKLPFYKRAFATPLSAGMSLLAIAVVLFGGWTAYSYGWSARDYYRTATNQALAEPIRSQILEAIEGGLRDAPVEAKTGDIYFPEVRLYLPRPEVYSKLTYRTDATEQPGEITITDRAVIHRQKAQLMNARDGDELFERVPKLQACARGVLLASTTDSAGSSFYKPELKQTIKLADGRTLYAYIEKDCQENTGTAELLKNLRPY
jgi:hypothetical protein